MFDFLKIQYELGKITAEQLHGYVPKWITEEQYLEIIEGENNAERNDS